MLASHRQSRQIIVIRNLQYMPIPVQYCFFGQRWTLMFSSHYCFYLFSMIIWCLLRTSDIGNSVELHIHRNTRPSGILQDVLETFINLEQPAEATEATRSSSGAIRCLHSRVWIKSKISTEFNNSVFILWYTGT